MKKAFSLLELIFVITILVLIGFFFNIKTKDNNIDNAANRLVLYLKQTRYQSLIENQKDSEETLWHKKRWTLKFFRCRKNAGGIYYAIYSDRNKAGHPNLDEALIDPLTKRRIYSSNKCETTSLTSKYVLLTKEFNIVDINMSCNSTTSLGQISFGNDGRVYSKLSAYDDEEYEYEIANKCEIELKSDKNITRTIIIEPKTGYIYAK